mmetsp:Transcript_7698/g.20966  ORF Transcript_7698/g.20966 Transcript_7698/m.20966 type:complete len:218 (-) Transcript_7698:2390-3043(-)
MPADNVRELGLEEQDGAQRARVHSGCQRHHALPRELLDAPCQPNQHLSLLLTPLFFRLNAKGIRGIGCLDALGLPQNLEHVRQRQSHRSSGIADFALHCQISGHDRGHDRGHAIWRHVLVRTGKLKNAAVELLLAVQECSSLVVDDALTALLHHKHVVELAQDRVRRLVNGGDDEHRALHGQLAETDHHGGRRKRVQPRGRLVHDQDPRIVHEMIRR